MSAPPGPAARPGAALRRLAGLTLDAALVGAASLGVLVLVAGSRWGLVLLALPLLALLAQQLRLVRSGGGRTRGLGRAPVARALAAAGTALALAAPQHDAGGAGSGLVAGLAAALLVAGLVGEPFVARAAAFRVPVAAHLPGIAPVPTFPDLRPHAVLASLVATGLGLLLAALSASPLWWLGASALGVVPLAALALTGVAKILQARRRRAALPAAVAAYAPDVVLYTGRPDDASYQLTMWLPYLQRTGLRFLVVTRNAVPAAALAARTDLPVVEVRAAGDLERLVVPSLRAALYVNASSANGAFVRFQHLTHVYLGHGDSDKPPSYNPTHALYDLIFAAGPAAVRRYAAHGVSIAAEKFRVVGRPQVEDVAPARGPIGEIAAPVVLYAPTWRGHVEESRLYSLPLAERVVAALLARRATVVFRPHPFSYDLPEDVAVIGRVHALLAEDRRRTGRPHLWGAAAERERGVLDCLNAADALVSDVSSVVSDHLQSGKPFAMVAVPSEPEEFVRAYPVAAASYVVRGDLADLEPQLDLMLGADPLRDQRLRLRADYLGDFPAEGYADVFVQAVRGLDRRPLPDLALEDDAAEGESPTGESRSGEEDERPLPGAAEDADPSTGGDAGAPAAVGSPTVPSPTRRRVGARRLRRHRALLAPALRLVATGLAVLALAAVLGRGAPGLVALLGIAATAVALGAAPRDVLRRSRQSRLLAEGLVTRAVLVVAVVALAAGRGPLGWPVWTGTLVLALALAVEPRVRAAWGSRGLLAVGLPAAVRPVRQRVPRGWPTLAGHGALVVGFVLVAVHAGRGSGLALWFGVVTVLQAVLAAEVLARALAQQAEARRGEERLRPTLTALGPRFALYLASDVRTGPGDEVARWLPRLQELDRPYVVVTRSVEMLRHVERLARRLGVTVPVVHRPTLRSLDGVVVPGLTTAFYLTNGVRNTHFVERRELTHVWLGGGADGATAVNPVHAVYDRVVVPDRVSIGRYADQGIRIPEEKFVVAGPTPQGWRDVCLALVDGADRVDGRSG